MEESAQKESDITVSLYNMGTVNKNKVSIQKGNKLVNLFFSYETLIAVDNTVSVNDWSMTTGKFLNELCPRKNERVPHAEVLAQAQKRIKAVLQ